MINYKTPESKPARRLRRHNELTTRFGNKVRLAVQEGLKKRTKLTLSQKKARKGSSCKR